MSDRIEDHQITELITAGFIRLIQIKAKIDKHILALCKLYIGKQFMLHSGQFDWKFTIDYENEEHFNSSPFEIGALSWVITAQVSEYYDKIAASFTLLQFPEEWHSILVGQTLYCEETRSKYTELCVYNQSDQNDGNVFMARRSLQFKQLTIVASITILRICQDINGSVSSIYELNNVYNFAEPQKFCLKYTLNKELMNVISSRMAKYYDTSVDPKQMFSFMFHAQIDKNNWQQDEKNCEPDETIRPLINLHILPPNTTAITVKYCLKCIETEKEITIEEEELAADNPSIDWNTSLFINRKQFKTFDTLTFSADIEITERTDLNENAIKFSGKTKQIWNNYIKQIAFLEMNTPQKEMYLWLKNIVGYPQYYDLFIENGVDNLGIVKYVTESTLIKVGISKVGHRLKIMHHVQEICNITNII